MLGDPSPQTPHLHPVHPHLSQAHSVVLSKTFSLFAIWGTASWDGRRMSGKGAEKEVTKESQRNESGAMERFIMVLDPARRVPCSMPEVLQIGGVLGIGEGD